MKKRSGKIIIAFLALVLLLSGCNWREQIQQPMERMTLSFITIGKGDAFLLEIPNGGYYMCDTGKKEDWEQIRQVLEKKKVKEFAGIFLSHGHKDHIGNVKNLLENYPVKTIYLSGKDHVSYKKTTVWDVAKEKGTQVKEIQESQKIPLGKAEAELWIPPKEDPGNENNNSMVLRINYGNISWLFTGDMEEGEEAVYLSQNRNIQAEILKLGHHGEADATSVAFLNRVKPDVALITGNQEENPASVNETISSRLQAYEIEPFYSEGEQLAIEFITDGIHTKIEKLGKKERVWERNR